jgi:hypothetical protein
MGTVPHPVFGAAPGSRLAAMSLAALGIVFGDIGTSPLYAFNTVLNLTGASPDAPAILGSQSWSRLSEQIFRVDKWSFHRGYAAMRIGSGLK